MYIISHFFCVKWYIITQNYYLSSQQTVLQGTAFKAKNRSLDIETK